MERLTEEWNENGFCNAADCGCEIYQRLAAYEDTNLTPEECAEYAKAKEEKHLLIWDKHAQIVAWEVANGRIEPIYADSIFTTREQAEAALEKGEK